ncbi:MAG: hypothetical protein O2856_03710 [Planctomycetota bacterium]|nr:hypothetical protein [Planctomycetota bacterium]
MTSPSNKSLTRVESSDSSTAQGLSHYIQGLQKPSVASVLTDALNNGSLNAMKASTALAADDRLNAILRGTSAYRYDEKSNPAQDFAVLSSGRSESASEALRRLTAGFLEARLSLQTALQQEGEGVADELRRVFGLVNAGYVLLIATTHNLMGNRDLSYRTQLDPLFQQLLENDQYLGGLAPKFVDLRDARAPGARRVALRLFFETFCSEAVEPTMYDEAISAIVQSILIRELRHVIEDEARMPAEQRHLAPYLAALFEQRMRDEIETARSRNGKPQPVLQALRRCPGEAKGLMGAVTKFLLESSEHTGSAVSCEVMLSVGCLLPESETVGQLAELIEVVSDLPPTLILLFSSALKFSQYVDDPQKRIDPQLLIEKGLQVLPALSADQRGRLITEVFAPLSDTFVCSLQLEPDVWENADFEFRAECIDSIFVPRIRGQLSNDPTNRIIDRAADRAIASALLFHLENCDITAVIDVPESTDALAEDTSAQPEGNDTPEYSVSTLPAICMTWLVLQTEACDFSPERNTLLVRHVFEWDGGAESLGLGSEAVSTLLRRGGFPTIQLLADRTTADERLARLLGDYTPTSESENALLRKVFEEQFINVLRKAINERAVSLDSRQVAEAGQMAKNEGQEGAEKEQKQIALLERQISVLQTALEQQRPFLATDRDWAGAQESLVEAEAVLKEHEALSQKELVEQRKVSHLKKSRDRVTEIIGQLHEIKAQRFPVTAEVRKELGVWSGDDVGFGQLQSMQEGLRLARERVTKLEQISVSADAAIVEINEEIQRFTAEIERLFPLVRYAFRSPAIREIDPAVLSLQSVGSTDLLGVMCRVHLVIESGRYSDSTDGSESGSPVSLVQLEHEIRTALQIAFRHAGSRPQVLATLKELAEFADGTSPLLKQWPDCGSLGHGASVSMEDLEADVSLIELLYRNLKFDLAPGKPTWLAYRPGWDESFHGPLLRLFARLALQENLQPLMRQRALAIALDGVTNWVNQEQEARQTEDPDPGPPETEKRMLSVGGFSVSDLLIAWTDILKVTQGIAASKNSDPERAKSRVAQFENNTNQLAIWAMAMLSDSSFAELDHFLLPAGKIFRSCAHSPDSALHPGSPAVREFILALKGTKERLAAIQEQPAFEQIQGTSVTQGPVGLDFGKSGELRDLALPSASPNWARLN